jgi:hypothetical protein
MVENEEKIGGRSSVKNITGYLQLLAHLERGSAEYIGDESTYGIGGIAEQSPESIFD